MDSDEQEIAGEPGPPHVKRNKKGKVSIYEYYDI